MSTVIYTTLMRRGIRADERDERQTFYRRPSLARLQAERVAARQRVCPDCRTARALNGTCECSP